MQSPSSSTETSVNLEAPDIPFDRERAFYPLRRDPSDNKIKPSYQWRECVRRFIWCVRWEVKTVYIGDLEWFLANRFGLKKRERPK